MTNQHRMFWEIYKNKCNDTVTLNCLMLNVYKIRKWLAACFTFRLIQQN